MASAKAKRVAPVMSSRTKRAGVSSGSFLGTGLGLTGMLMGDNNYTLLGYSSSVYIYGQIIIFH